MDYVLWIIAIWFLFEAANVVHWRFKSNEKWQYIPTAGTAAMLNWAMMTLISIVAILFLANFVPMLICLIVAFGYQCIMDFYSILMRTRQRRMDAIQSAH